MQDNFEKMSPDMLTAAIKAYLYLNKYTELNSLLDSYKVDDAPIALTIILLRETKDKKNLLPNRILLQIKAIESLKNRAEQYLQVLKELE